MRVDADPHVPSAVRIPSELLLLLVFRGAILPACSLRSRIPWAACDCCWQASAPPTPVRPAAAAETANSCPSTNTNAGSPFRAACRSCWRPARASAPLSPRPCCHAEPQNGHLFCFAGMSGFVLCAACRCLPWPVPASAAPTPRHCRRCGTTNFLSFATSSSYMCAAHRCCCRQAWASARQTPRPRRCYGAHPYFAVVESRISFLHSMPLQLAASARERAANASALPPLSGARVTVRDYASAVAGSALASAASLLQVTPESVCPFQERMWQTPRYRSSRCGVLQRRSLAARWRARHQRHVS